MRPGESSEIPTLPSCGDFDMRIAKDGTWFYRGSPIGRLPLVKLFSTVLRREDDGQFWLVTPVERGLIEVEDAPFIAVELLVKGSGKDQELHFRSNVDDWTVLDDEHGLRVAHDPETGEPRPYIHVRRGLEALLVRSVFYQLVELAEPEDDSDTARMGVWSKGCFFPLEASA
ncbi:DUF1285 domain-containing protein [Rhodovibrionaceae bacterium A322]